MFAMQHRHGYFMPLPPKGFFANWRHDLPSALVVFLVALPLCLGVALASGAPLFSGLIAGIVGGVVVGAISKSPLSVSGPAAGLTVIVFTAIQQLPTFEAFLLAVCLGGMLQILLGTLRAGVIGDFIPNAVITGMLAAIGLILVMKQLPHALGYDLTAFGGESLHSGDFQHLWGEFRQLGESILPGAAFIAITSLVFLFWWDKKQPKTGIISYLPGPLIVVLYGILANWLFGKYMPGWQLESSHLVAVPVATSASEFIGQFSLPDFAMITDPTVWTVAITLALVASIESLLSIEAIDKLDPYRRVTPTNRELVAQGFGNMASGLIGGLPVTSVIVRSSANVGSGARSKLSTITHGLLLLGSVIAVPMLLNTIPLAALAAVLIALGYKLTKPAIYVQKYQKGLSHFLPFVITVAAIMMTDLLLGVMIGVLVGAVFILVESLRSLILKQNEGNEYSLRFNKDVFFLHKYDVKRSLATLPDNASVLLDFSRIYYVDKDTIEIIQDFMVNAPHRGIKVRIRDNPEAEIKWSKLLPVAA